MTTIAGVIAKDCIVVGADGRSTKDIDGSICRDNEEKIFDITEQCALLITGGFADNTNVVVDNFRSLARADFKEVSHRIDRWKRMTATFINSIINKALISERNDWATDPNLIFVVAGYDTKRHLFRTRGEPKLFKIPNDGKIHRRPANKLYFAYGSGGKLALEVLENYKQVCRMMTPIY